MDELEKLYNVLTRDGYYTKSFDEFKTKWSDTDYQQKVYDVVSRDELYTKDYDSFINKYVGGVDVKKKDESQPIVEEDVTESVTEEETVPTGSSDVSDQEVEVDTVVEEDVITDGSPKIQEQDRGIEETKGLDLEGLKISAPENVRPTNESINPLTGNPYNINNMMEAASLKVAQEEWDKKYGGTKAQSEKNIAGLNAAKEQELKNSAPDKHQEIEERYGELIDQEKFDQTQATGTALGLAQKTREFDESLSRTPTEQEELGAFSLVEEEQTSEPRSIFSLLSYIGGARMKDEGPRFKLGQKASDDTINRALGEYQTLAEQDVARYFIGDKATAEELNDIKVFQEFANKTLFDKGKTSREKYNILEEEYTRLQDKMNNTSFDKKLDVRAAYEGKNKKQYIIDLNDAELKNYILNGEGDVEMVKMLYTAKRKLDKYLANQPLIDSLNSDGSVNFKEGVDDSAKEVITMDVKSLLDAVQAAEDNSIAAYRDGATEKRETFGKLVTRIRNAQAELATLDPNSTEYKELAARITKTEADADKMRDEILTEGTQVTSILKTSPDEIIEQTKVAIELSPSARAAFSEKIEGLSSYEQFQRAYHQLREETNRLREEGGFSEGSILGAMGRGARRILNVKEFGLNVGKKEKEWLANRELLNNLAPILLTNTPGISKEDSNFFDAFGAAFAKGLVGESGIKSQTGMIQDQLRGLPELGVTADDYTEEDIVEQLEKITETDLDSWEFWGDMGGSTSAIIGALGITKRGLKKMTTQDALVKRIAKNYNKAMDKNATRRFVKKALQQGVEFETAGIVFDNQQEELSFEGGFLGTLGGELIQKVAGKIPVSDLVKLVASKFGKEGKRAAYVIQRAGEIISRGGGEVGEETTQELTQLYNSNLEDQGFWEAATERFGDFDENMKFIVGSFAMGTAFGMMQPSDVKARYNKLNKEQKKRVDDVINTIDDTQKEVVKETVEGEVKKEGKVEEEVTEEDIIVTDPTKGYTFEYTSEEDIPTELQDIKPLGKTEITKGKTKKDATKSIRITFSGQQLLDAGIGKPPSDLETTEVTEEVVEETPAEEKVITREDIEKIKAKQEANQVVYNMNKTDKKIWSKDFEILDNRKGQEESSIDEEGDKIDNKWLVVNKVTGEILYATSKKDAQNIVDTAPAYAELFGDGTKVESENIITPTEVTEENIIIKTKEDAISEPSTESVDVQESTRDSETVGEGDVRTVTETQEAETKIKTKAKEESEKKIDSFVEMFSPKTEEAPVKETEEQEVSLADKIREGKLKGKGTMSTIIPVEVWDTALEGVALTVETIEKVINKIKQSDWYKSRDVKARSNVDKELQGMKDALERGKEVRDPREKAAFPEREQKISKSTTKSREDKLSIKEVRGAAKEQGLSQDETITALQRLGFSKAEIDESYGVKDKEDKLKKDLEFKQRAKEEKEAEVRDDEKRVVEELTKEETQLKEKLKELKRQKKTVEKTAEFVVINSVENITRESIKKETRLKIGKDGDIKASFVAKKGAGGNTIEGLVEDLVDEGGIEGIAGYNPLTREQVFDIIIEVLQKGKRKVKNEYLGTLNEDIKDTQENVKQTRKDIRAGKRTVKERVETDRLRLRPRYKKITKKKVSPKDKKVIVNERTALRDQIKLQAKSSRDSVKAYKDAQKSIIDSINEMSKTGVITNAQSKAMIKKVLRTNMLNDKLVDRLIDYIEKVYDNADYQAKVNKANTKRRRAIENLKGKVGPNPELQAVLRELFTLNANIIPVNKLDSYLKLAEEFGQRKRSLKNLRDSGKVMDEAADIINSITEEPIDKDGFFIVSEKNTIEELEQALTEAKTDVEKEMIKELIEAKKKENKEIKEKFKKLVNDIISNKIDLNNVLKLEDAQDLARELNNLTKKDIEALVTTKNGVSDYTMVENLQTIKDNMNNGYVPALANTIMNKVKTNRNATTIEEVVKTRTKKLDFRMFFSAAYGKVKELFSFRTKRSGFQQQLRNTMTSAVDDVFGNFNKKTIYNSVFRPLGVAYETFTSNYAKNVAVKLEAAEKLISKTKVPTIIRTPLEIFRTKAKIQMLRIQREFESNPGNKQVASANDFIDATIKANERANEPRYTDAEIKILKELKEEFSVDGEIDLAKLRDSFSRNENKAIKLIDEAGDLEQKANWTATVIRGTGIKPIANYVHHSVIDYKDDQGKDFAVKQVNKMKVSTKAKTMIERTPGAKAIDFDPISSTARGARDVMMDYYMTDAVRVALATVAKVKEDIIDSDTSTKYQKEAVKALDQVTNDVIDNVLNKSFRSTGIGTKIYRELVRLGYEAALASVPRAAAELGSNMTYAILSDPEAFIRGVAQFGALSTTSQGFDIMQALGSTETMKNYDTKNLTSKTVDQNIITGILSPDQLKDDALVEQVKYLLQFTGLPQTRRLTREVASKMLSTPDRALSRPLWFAAFTRSFKDITGETLTAKDLIEIGEGTSKYLDAKYKDAIKDATAFADGQGVKMSNSRNPFNVIPKNMINADDDMATKAYKTINGYMASFMLNEYVTARNAVLALTRSGDMSKAQAAGTMAGAIARMGVYVVLYQVFQSIYDLLLGYEEDEDEKEDVSDLMLRQMFGAVTTLITGRGMGQVGRIGLNYGLEMFNENYLGFLRDGEIDPETGLKEYDSFDDAIVFSLLNDKDLERKSFPEILVKALGGPLSPLLKSVTRTGTDIQLRYQSKKDETKAKYQKRIDEALFYDGLGQLGLIPFYKDLKRVARKKRYQKEQSNADSMWGIYGSEARMKKIGKQQPEVQKELERIQKTPEYKKLKEERKEENKKRKEREEEKLKKLGYEDKGKVLKNKNKRKKNRRYV